MSETQLFKEKFYPSITQDQWNDWQWQLANRITKQSEIERVITLTSMERQALEQKGAFPFAITPYYASLLKNCPAIRKTMLPDCREQIISAGETNDPLGEEPCMVAPNLVHRYPDRVLFLTTDFCSAYCRYCTRARLVGKQKKPQNNQWEKAFEYIRSNKNIRDVLVSGGDPLTLSDEKIDYLLSSLRSIPHVEMIRIGTKVPAVLPMRITDNLLNIIKKYHPIYLSMHWTHPVEMTKESFKACENLANAGVVMGSQTVLLKGVNDNAVVLKNLMHALLKARVRPYYLFQCDPIAGSAHFRVPIKKGIELINSLRGHTSGYAVPTYAIDIPGGGGKIIINDERCVGRDGDFVLLKNFENKIYPYPDPENND